LATADDDVEIRTPRSVPSCIHPASKPSGESMSSPRPRYRRQIRMGLPARSGVLSIERAAHSGPDQHGTENHRRERQYLPPARELCK
jgi:hypothetical protein